MKRIYRWKKKKNFRNFLSNVNLAGSLGLWWGIGVAAIGFAVFVTKDASSIFYLFPILLLFLSCVYGKRREGEQLAFYRQLEEFIGRLQMYYGYFQDMEEAVYEAAVFSGKRIFPLGNWLQECFRDVRAGKEEAEIPSFLRFDEEQAAYVQLLVEIGKAGIKGEEDGLSTEESLRRLKEEIREKAGKIKSIREGFSGLLEICLLTAYALPFAKAWGASTLEELKSWYEGGQAVLYMLVCLILSMGMYLLLAWLRFENRKDFRKNLGKERKGKGGNGKEGGIFGEQKRMAELLRFYDWLLLKRENAGSSLEEVLMGLIPLASGRRQKVERLFYDYMQYGISALEKLRDREESSAFAGILEGMIRCDQISLKKAFASFETERDYYLEQMKEEQKKVVREAVTLGKLLAFLPLYGLILFMLVLPFTTQGLAMLESYSRMFGN